MSKSPFPPDFLQDIIEARGTSEFRVIEGIRTSGFASYGNPQTVSFYPLTILAGSNSAGKSSSMKPLLLLKQTLDHPIDPGPLLISGANVQFTNLHQLFTKAPDEQNMDTANIEIKMARGSLSLSFSQNDDADLTIKETSYTQDIWLRGSEDTLRLQPDMKPDDIESQLPITVRESASREATNFKEFAEPIAESIAESHADETTDESNRGEYLAFLNSKLREEYWTIRRQRCFLTAALRSFGAFHRTIDPSGNPQCDVASALKTIIHVPAFRRKQFRNYPTAEVASSFPGTFEDYTASVVAKWQADKNDKLNALIDTLRDLHLTSSVKASRVSDAEVELLVARPGQQRSQSNSEMVSLADVGIGVSYVLPVLVALEVAESGQMVYVEQPESHLHPRAEYGLAKALVRAARRGVRVVVETHSSLLLLHIQTLVADGAISADSVGLHWFSLGDNGFTSVDTREPDEHGRTGDWPEDFADIEMHASSEFIRAARRR